MTDVQAVEAAHQTARARNTDAIEAARAARAALAEAAGAKEALITSATRGATVTAGDLRAAEEKARDADAAAALAEAARQHAAHTLATAHAELLRAQAADLLEQVNTTSAAQTAAGLRLSEAVAAAMCMAAAFNAAAAAHAEACHRAAAHDHHVDQFAPGNPLLGSQHRSVWPMTRIGAVNDPAVVEVEAVRRFANGRREAIEDLEVFAFQHHPAKVAA